MTERITERTLHVRSTLTSPIDIKNTTVSTIETDSNHAPQESSSQKIIDITGIFKSEAPTQRDSCTTTKYCVHSFRPSLTATPAADGFFGVLRCEGACATMKEMEQECTKIVTFCDPYACLRCGEVGKILPLTPYNVYSQKEKKINLRESKEETKPNDNFLLKQKVPLPAETSKDEEEQDTGPDDIPDNEDYLMLRFEYDKLSGELLAELDQHGNCKKIIDKANADICALSPPENYKDIVREKYLSALKSIGMSLTDIEHHNYFLMPTEEVDNIISKFSF